MLIAKWAELADKEKNRLIHEEVMGHSPDEPCTGRFVPLDPEPDGQYCTGCGVEIGWGSKEYHERPAPPAYVTSMDAAWKIVEKMVARMDKHEENFEWFGPIRSKGYGRGIVASHSFDYTKKGGIVRTRN